MRRGRSCGFPRSAVRFLLCSLGMAALPSGALVLARGFGVHNESLADFWLGRVGDAAGEVELLKGEVSRLRAEQQWLAISRIPRMPAAEGFSWPDGQNGQVSDHQRRGEAPQYPRQLHPVAEASEFATTRRFSKPTRRLITPEDLNKRDEVLKLFIKKSMGFRLNQLDTLSELSLNEDILRAFGESSLAEARPEAREPIQRRGVRSPARLDVRQSHMLFLQPDCDTVVAPLADFRSADGADLPPVQTKLGQEEVF